MNMEGNVHQAAHMTRWLACGTLAVVLACILAGCNQGSGAPGQPPTEAELTEPTATAEPTPTVTPESTPTSTPEPTSTPKPKLEPINLNPSILDQLPATERSCLLFSMEEDDVDDILTNRTASAEEIEAIAGCISEDTTMALLLGVMTDRLGSISGETSACMVDRLEKVEKDVPVVVMFGGDDEVILDYGEEVLEDFGESTSHSLFLCLNKEEWTTITKESRLNVDDVGIDALRCFLNGLGPSGFFEFVDAAERSDATLSLEMFSAAGNCGIDLESLLLKQPRREPTATPPHVATAAPVATATPLEQPQPTQAPQPQPTLVPTPTRVPAATASPPTAPVRYGGEVSLAVAEDPFDGNFSPFDGESTYQKAQVNSLIFSRLMRKSASGGIEPDLAAWWEVRHDGREWVVGLRENASFHDGRPVIAEDVLYSIIAMDERFNTLPDPAPDFAVPDDYTLVIEFEEPVWDFPSRMTQPGSVIVPRGMLGAGVRDFTQLVGSGPFRPVDYVRGQSLTLERNPHYYETGLPYLDRINIHFIPERAARQAASLTGQLDYLGFPYTGLPALTLEVARDYAAEVTFAPYPEVYALWFDTQTPPFDDLRVRHAVLRAIDPQLIDSVAGKGELQSSIPRALFPEWTTDLDEQRAVENWHAFDPEWAREVLAEAGYPDGFDTVMQIPSGRFQYWRSVAEVVTEMLSYVGIRVMVEITPGELRFAPADRGIKLIRVEAFGGDAVAFLREHFAAGGSYNYSRTDVGVPGLDPDRPDSIRPVQAELAELVFYIPLPAPVYARREWVHGPLTALDIYDIGRTLKEVWIER